MKKNSIRTHSVAKNILRKPNRITLSTADKPDIQKAISHFFIFKKSFSELNHTLLPF